jgi:hypothetical protein
MRLTLEEFQKRFPDKAQREFGTTPIPPPARPNKFNAIQCSADGIKFSSKKERRRYLELMALKNAGECWFLRQVPFHLPGNVKYVLDFLIFWKDGRTTFEDVKGRRLPLYILKKKQVEELYPVRIIES